MLLNVYSSLGNSQLIIIMEILHKVDIDTLIGIISKYHSDASLRELIKWLQNGGLPWHDGYHTISTKLLEYILKEQKISQMALLLNLS